MLQKIIETIQEPDKKIYDKVKRNWDDIAKPLNSLGYLECIHAKMASIYNCEQFTLKKRCVVPICADNGVVEEGVTQTGQEVTAIVTRNFLDKKTSVCQFAQIAKCDVIPVDLGLAVDINDSRLIVHKISYGTKNIAKEAAMSKEQALEAIYFGINFVQKLKSEGYDIIATGEMGIGNTTTSSAVAAVLLNKEPCLVTGYGSGLSQEGFRKKIAVIEKAIKINNPNPLDVIDIIAKLGGYDIACMCGMFIGGALHKVPIVIDGLISSVAALCAMRLAPVVVQYAIASHLSNEVAAKLILQELGLSPIIHANMYVGEGTGAVSFFPLIDMACAVYDNMPTFEKINIEAYTHFDK